MFQIDSPSTTSTMPTPNAVGTPGWFQHGNASTGTQYTVVTSDFLNGIQAELLNILSAGGVTQSKTNQAQVLAALQNIFRVKLTTTLNLYVSTTGSDSNTGLSSGTPFATMQKAATVAQMNYDTQGNTIQVNVANGTYTGQCYCGGLLGNGLLYFKGTSQAVTIVNLTAAGNCFNASFNANVWVDTFTLGAPVGSNTLGYTPGDCLTASLGGNLAFKNITFGGAQRAHMEVGAGGYISAIGPYTISAGSQFHLIAGIGQVAIGQWNNAGTPTAVAVTLTGTPAFNAYAWSVGGYAYLVGATYNGATIAPAGAATGQRYLAQYGGSINTFTSNVNTLPGSTAGDSSTGYYL